jgi:hypothetical protein
MGTTSDLFNGIADRLQTKGIGKYNADPTIPYADTDTAIKRGGLPTGPDQAIAIRVMPAVADVASPFATFLFQALCRGLPHDVASASDLTDAVRDALLGLTDTWFGSTHVVQIRFSGQVDLDPDQNDRDQWSLKLLLDIDEAPTDLRPEGGWD